MSKQLEWWHALALVLAVTALVTTSSVLDVQSEMASGERIEYFGMVIQGVLNVVGGLLVYLAWRIGNSPAIGWLSSALVFLGLQDFPFLLSQLSDPTNQAARQGEGAEVFAALVLLALFAAAARGSRFRGPDPALVGVMAAVVMVGVRYVVGHTDLLPHGFSDGTAWYERALVVAICSALFVCVLRTRAYSAHTRVVLAVVVVATGTQCALDTAHSVSPGEAPAVVVGIAVVTMGLLLLDAGIRCLLDALNRHQSAMEEVARQALQAESRARSGAELLHEVRSTVGGLATATELLSTRQGLSDEQRSRLQRAVADQLLRVDRTLNDTSDQVQAFEVTRVIDPVVDFHRCSGQQIDWTPPTGPLTVRHVPDAVAQVLGTLLHNAARHAPGRPVRVALHSADEQVLVSVTQPGPAVDPQVQAHLFERGARSTSSPGEGLGLHVARRLMTEHGGDLCLQDSHDTRTTFVAAIPRESA